MSSHAMNAARLRTFEGHNPDAMRIALEAGAHAGSPIRGKAPVEWLLGEYTRWDLLSECLELLHSYGAQISVRALFHILTDRATSLHFRRAEDFVRSFGRSSVQRIIRRRPKFEIRRQVAYLPAARRYSWYVSAARVKSGTAAKAIPGVAPQWMISRTCE